MLRNESQKERLNEDFKKKYDSIKNSSQELTAALAEVQNNRYIESKTSCMGIRGPNFAMLEYYDLEIKVLEKMLENCSSLENSAPPALRRR